MKLFTNNQSLREFLIDRNHLLHIYYLTIVIAYSILYLIFCPSDTPTLSMVITVLASPVILLPQYLRVSSFIFRYNWFFLLYMIGTTILFFYSVLLFNEMSFYGNNYVTYEITHYFGVAFLGFIIAAVISFPFKIVYLVLYDGDDLYYDSNCLNKLEKTAFPEKFEKEVEKKKETLKYDNFNETQLHVELNLAIKEDRFEDAERIKKLLETKFR